MTHEYKHKPGSYQARFEAKRKPYAPSDSMTDTTFALLKTDIADIVIMADPSDPEGLKDGVDDADNVVSGVPGTDVVLVLKRTRGGRGGINLGLTNLTEVELALIRRIFEMAFDIAEPIVKERDAHALAAEAAGNDSQYRLYRVVPRLIDRSGRFPQHDASLQHRPSDDAAGHAGDGD